jgi:hypothetical protein
MEVGNGGLEGEDREGWKQRPRVGILMGFELLGSMVRTSFVFLF